MLLCRTCQKYRWAPPAYDAPAVKHCADMSPLFGAMLRGGNVTDCPYYHGTDGRQRVQEGASGSERTR